MNTCFIFFDGTVTSETDVPEALWAVSLDEAGAVDAPLSCYTIDELKGFSAKSAKTIAVLASTIASIKYLNLPKLSPRKAREAIPFALEDELAEPIERLQFAFRRSADALVYEVAVVNKLRLMSCIEYLHSLELTFDSITIDWCALAPNEMIATDAYLLVNQQAKENSVLAALNVKLAKDYLKKGLWCEGIYFTDSAKSLCHESFSKEACAYKLWVAKRLLQHDCLELLPKVLKRKQEGSKKSYKIYGALVAIWFFSVIFSNAFQLHTIHKRDKIIDAEIASVYHVFFPNAKRVISPRFRIERLMATSTQPQKRAFWTVLDKLSSAYGSHPLEITEMEFHDDKIWLHVTAADFTSLEAFEDSLKKGSLSVKQQEAAAHHHQVVAVLELEA